MEEIQAQSISTRILRAYSALRAGRFQITRIAPGQWTVTNGDQLPYTVVLKADTWSCTCPDYLQHGPQVLCKHIESVRICEAAPDSTFQKMETQMDENEASQETHRILQELRRPLDAARVKRRQVPGLGSLPYLEGHDVIDRANAIFNFAWSFDLTGEPVIVRWQKTVMVWNEQKKQKTPQTDAHGTVQTEGVGLVYITGKVTIELDGKMCSHADLGRCIFTGDTPEALDMALAGAVTDCLKRCFRHLGDQFGLLLYDKEITRTAGMETHPAASSPFQPVGSRPSLVSPAHRQYGDGIRVNGNRAEQEAFDQYLKREGKNPASRDELRDWLSMQRSRRPQQENQPAALAA